jgi:hypothetical protein
MKKVILSILLALAGLQPALAESLPVRGLYLYHGASVADIITLIEEELAPAGFNMLILGSGWNYEYQSHSELHRVLFDLINELVDVFETKMFHAGMDEITIIGDSHCPRCHDHDPAELLANEVTVIHNHLQARGVRMMIWGDRLIDACATGEENPFHASMNGTARAIDLIPKDIFICDWHYGKAMLTPLLFAMKGFDVASCSSHNIDVAREQIDNMRTFRRNTNGEPRSHFQGLIHTIWGSRDLMENYRRPAKKSDVSALKELVEQFKTVAPLQKLISPIYRTTGEPQFADLAPRKEMIEAISWTGGTPSKRFVDDCHAAGIPVYLTVSRAPGMSAQQVQAFMDSFKLLI